MHSGALVSQKGTYTYNVYDVTDTDESEGLNWPGRTPRLAVCISYYAGTNNTENTFDFCVSDIVVTGRQMSVLGSYPY